MRRIAALDGLRGLAALVVVFHHALLVNASMAAAYGPDRWTNLTWIMTKTPLHAIWNGPAAVTVFFVLSGYVLAQPALAMGISWAEYYPKRLVRLYLPVAGAVVLAVVWMHLIARGGGSSWWVRAHYSPSWSGVLHDLVLIPDPPGATNSVLWSLRWEVYFSILLPTYLMAGRLLRAIPAWVLCSGLAVLSAIPTPPHAQALQYLPIFGCGVALAYSGRPARSGRRTALALGGLAICGLNAPWLLSGVPGRSIEVASACPLTWLTLHDDTMKAVLKQRVPAWFGSRSFSLYLVHEPIIVSFALSCGRWAPIAALVVAVPVSLAVAEIFYRVVELPSIRAAKQAGRWSARTAETFSSAQPPWTSGARASARSRYRTPGTGNASG